MSKYIDADRLRLEIEKTYKSEIAPWLSGVSAKSAIYDYVMPLIESLQQESAPSKEEVADRIADWISRNPDFFFDGDTKEVINEIRKLV